MNSRQILNRSKNKNKIKEELLTKIMNISIQIEDVNPYQTFLYWGDGGVTPPAENLLIPPPRKIPPPNRLPSPKVNSPT